MGIAAPAEVPDAPCSCCLEEEEEEEEACRGWSLWAWRR
jgi:hypothetical protein